MFDLDIFIMKKILFLFAICCVSLTSCDKDLSKEIIGTWEVSSFKSANEDSASKVLLEQIEKSEKSTSIEFVNDSIMNIITPDGKFEASYELESDSNIVYQINGITTFSTLGKFNGEKILKNEQFANGHVDATIEFSKKK